jgi:hypothetical protein
MSSFLCELSVLGGETEIGFVFSFTAEPTEIAENDVIFSFLCELGVLGGEIEAGSELALF